MAVGLPGQPLDLLPLAVRAWTGEGLSACQPGYDNGNGFALGAAGRKSKVKVWAGSVPLEARWSAHRWLTLAPGRCS